MVSIKNISVKKIVEFKGHEGEPLVQCDVYYKNKRVGFFSQDSWGGPDRFDTYENESEIDNDGLEKLAKEYLEDKIKSGKENGFYKANKEFYDIHTMILDIIQLNDYHKVYTKNLKKGAKITAILQNKDNEFAISVIGFRDNIPQQEFEKVKEISDLLETHRVLYYFTSENDFIVE